MEKKKPSRRKKTLDIVIDTKNVDITIKRDEEGNVEASLDTPKIDVEYTKKDGEKSLGITIDDHAEYEFISNGDAKTMPKGTLWRITGAMLKIFLHKKFGRLK
jgi:hypothetical protein